MSKPARKLNRRRFITRSTSLAAASVVASQLLPLVGARAAVATDFVSEWQGSLDHVWLGQDLWANPMQDWRIAMGRIECTNPALDRNVHLLTRQLAARDGTFSASVSIGRVEGGPISKGKGSAGFRIGIQGPLREYRNSLIYGKGLDAGISADGALFIGEVHAAKPGVVKLEADAVTLRLNAAPGANGGYALELLVLDAGGKELGRISKEGVPATQLVGNLALVNNFGAGGAGGGAGKAKAKKKADEGAYNPGAGEFWFSDWKVAGTKIDATPDHAFGPILFSQYTLSGGVLKLTAQMPALGAQDTPKVQLQVKDGANWSTIADEQIHAEAGLAAFTVPKWNDQKDVSYRLLYRLKSKAGATEHYWTGTIRRDPVAAPVLTVADVSCNIHQAFPNQHYVANMAKLNPDLLAFTGDQFYESSGGYGIQRAPVDKAMLDYLRKWYLHGWTWRELTRDRPSLSLPDDHDVYQGNLWGEGGDGRKTTQEAGGYDMPVEWVNVVYRTQTAHHPAPYESKPAKRGTLQYFGAMTYGRVSFAILADRQYKSGPEGKVPATGSRGDHVGDPNFDPKTADVPGVELLGAAQLKFLKEWVADWRGADMKSVISQTVFTAMATTHGGQREVLRADYDANGWPQTPRNHALREIRKAFAVHIAGDQHLPAVVHYGVDDHRDGPVAFAGPAVNVGYPRWWEPATAKWTQPKQKESLLGDFTDSFGHPMSVLAVKNGAVQPHQGDVLQAMDDKASGLGLVRFDKAARKIIIECWPFLANPLEKGTQFPGWPVTVEMLDNYGRKPVAHLPKLQISGVKEAVVQIFDETNGEMVYALRLNGSAFQPHVFATGKYTVKIGDPDAGKLKELKGLEASVGNQASLIVKV